MVGTQALRLGCCAGSSVILNDQKLRQPFVYYTISLWFREEQAAPDTVRYLYEEGAAYNGIAIRLNGQNVEAAVIELGGGPKKVQSVSQGPVELNKWHHVALVYFNGRLELYLDGKAPVSIETGLGIMSSRNNGASIGRGGLTDFSTGIQYIGLIDDLKIWNNVALTEPEVKMIYERPTKPNFLLFIADDLNYDSLGFMGGVAPNVTPHLDSLAQQSVVFKSAHAAVSVCQPSRQSMLSGKYPQNYGSVGFHPMAEGTQTVVTRLSDEGYFTSNLHKMWHMQPSSSFPWDMTEDTVELKGREFQSNRRPKRIGRSPSMLAEASRVTMQMADEGDQPFFLIVNSADSHRPFPGSESSFSFQTEQIENPSRLYDPSEVIIPHPLPDIPYIREDVAKYASSVRRLDDTIGATLRVLEEEGHDEDTIVMFTSDNGMPFPFGKFDTYRDSLNAPLLVRWPGRFAPRVDASSLVSLIDIAPTIVQLSQAQPLLDIDGSSLLPLLNGDANVAWRDCVVGTRYEDIFYGIFIDRYPDPAAKRAELRSEGWVDATDHSALGTMKRTMNKRSITDGRYQYIYNHFFDEDGSIPAFPYETRDYLQMQQAALSNATLAERLEFYRRRAKEEFYDRDTDPGSYLNLIEDPVFQAKVETFRQKLMDWMIATNDTIADDFQSHLLEIGSSPTFMPTESLVPLSAPPVEPSAAPSSAPSLAFSAEPSFGPTSFWDKYA